MNKISLLLALTFDFLDNLSMQLLMLQNMPIVSQQARAYSLEDNLKEIENHPDVQPYIQNIENLENEIQQITVDQIQYASEISQRIDDLEENAKRFSTALKPRGFGHHKRVVTIQPIQIIQYQEQQIQLEYEVRKLEAQIAQQNAEKMAKLEELQKKEIELLTASLSVLENPAIDIDRSKFDPSALIKKIKLPTLPKNVLKGAQVEPHHHTLFQQANEISEEMSHAAKKAKFEEAKGTYERTLKKLLNIDVKISFESQEELVHEMIKSLDILKNKLPELEQQKLTAQGIARDTAQIALEYKKLAIAQSKLPIPSAELPACQIDLTTASTDVKQQAKIVQESQSRITELTKKLDHKLNIKTAPFNFFTFHEATVTQNLGQHPVSHGFQTTVRENIYKAQNAFTHNQDLSKLTPNAPAQTIKTPQTIERAGIKMSQTAAQAAQSFLRVLKLITPK